MRGRREATSLARCRAQIEHRSRDGRRIRRCRARCHQRAPKRTTIAPAAHAANSRDNRARNECPRDQISRGNRTRSSGQSGSRSARHFPHNSPRFADANDALTDSRHCHRQRWRERPLRTRAGPLEARAPGSLTPWFPALTLHRACSVGGKERRPSCVARALTRGTCGQTRVGGGASGWRRQQGDPDEADC